MSEKTRRVWQYVPVFVRTLDEAGNIIMKVKDDMAFPQYVTMMRERGMIDGNSVSAVFLRATPNGAGQYVINPTAQYYEEQCKAMQDYAASSGGRLIEITNRKFEVGQVPEELMPKPVESPEVVALKKELADAQAKLKASKIRE